MMSVRAAFEATVAAGPQRNAICTEDRSLTYGELQASVVGAARTLHATWGVGPGDRVGYLGPNRAEELVLLLALARLGAVFVPVNTRLAVTELVGIVAHARLRALVTDAGYDAVGAAVLDALSTAAPALRSIDALATSDEGPGEAAPGRIDAHAPLLLAYTSGTTGAPKGALHTHGGMLANVAAAIDAHALVPSDRVLAALPLFHVGGLCIQTLPALLAGASVVLLPRFDARLWLDAVATRRPTLALMVPATLRALIDHADWAGTDLSSLRVLMTGSQIVPRRLIDAVHARGVAVGQVYGSTETGPVTVVLKAGDARRKVGSAGWPCFAGSVRLVDTGGGDVPPGAVGEIVVRAPNVMAGYWDEPAGSGFSDGWFSTGDLGRHDDDGCLEVVGRVRDLIITGGENVYPAEVEDVLLAISGVAEAAVIGVADDRWGEVPIAFVVRDRGAVLDEGAVMAALAGRIARFKQPKRVVFVDVLPRNAMGKVQKHLLSAGDLSTASSP